MPKYQRCTFQGLVVLAERLDHDNGGERELIELVAQCNNVSEPNAEYCPKHEQLGKEGYALGLATVFMDKLRVTNQLTEYHWRKKAAGKDAEPATEQRA